MAVEQQGNVHLLERLSKYLYSRVPGYARKTTSPVVCCICLENIEETQMVRRLPCTHLYHQPCFDRWFLSQSKAKCPICQQDIVSMYRAHERYMNTDCGGATRLQLLGFDRVEFSS